jgi:hypothetical protein
MFSEEIGESKTRNLDAAKNRSTKKCTAVYRNDRALVSKAVTARQATNPKNVIRRSGNALLRRQIRARFTKNW